MRPPLVFRLVGVARSARVGLVVVVEAVGITLGLGSLGLLAVVGDMAAVATVEALAGELAFRTLLTL